MRLHRYVAVVFGVALPLGLGGCAAVVQAPAASPAASASPSPTPPASPTLTASPSPTAAQTTPALGPKGLGELALGMTKAQARGTGLATGISGARGTCGGAKDGRLIGADRNDDLSGKLFFSTTTNRLVIIAATDDVATPEGVSLGTRTADVRAAYATWKGNLPDSFGVGYVRAPGNAKAYYRIGVRDGEVVELTLQSLDQDCAE